MNDTIFDVLIEFWWLWLPFVVIYYVTGTKVKKTYYGSGWFGKIKDISKYKNGVLHGEQVMFHPNGNIAVRANFYKGVPCGRVEEYYEDGIFACVKKYQILNRTTAYIRNITKTETNKKKQYFLCRQQQTLENIT